MKYKPEIYSRALAEALNSKTISETDILKNFLRAVQKNGDWIGISKILRAAETRLVKNRGGRMVLVESARDLPKNVAERFLKKFEKEDKVEFSKNPLLIAGARITIDGERELNFSFRRKLNKLFR